MLAKTKSRSTLAPIFLFKISFELKSLIHQHSVAFALDFYPDGFRYLNEVNVRYLKHAHLTAIRQSLNLPHLFHRSMDSDRQNDQRSFESWFGCLQL